MRRLLLAVFVIVIILDIFIAIIAIVFAVICIIKMVNLMTSGSAATNLGEDKYTTRWLADLSETVA